MSIKHKGQRWIVEAGAMCKALLSRSHSDKGLEIGRRETPGTLVPTLSSQKLVHGSVGIVPGASCMWLVTWVNLLCCFDNFTSSSSEVSTSV